MSRQISVFIPCVPPTATSQQKGAFAMKGGGVRFYKKASVKAAENTWFALLHPHAPKEPFQGPLCLVLRIVRPWRKTEKKSRSARFSSYPIETRPDCSNIVKGIEDVMTTLGFWNDDSQISSLTVRKTYGDRPGLGINLTSDLAESRDGGIVSIE